MRGEEGGRGLLTSALPLTTAPSRLACLLDQPRSPFRLRGCLGSLCGVQVVSRRTFGSPERRWRSGWAGGSSVQSERLQVQPSAPSGCPDKNGEAAAAAERRVQAGTLPIRSQNLHCSGFPQVCVCVCWSVSVYVCVEALYSTSEEPAEALGHRVKVVLS